MSLNRSPDSGQVQFYYSLINFLNILIYDWIYGWVYEWVARKTRAFSSDSLDGVYFVE